jgi:ATP-dependent DNA helicase RecG
VTKKTVGTDYRNTKGLETLKHEIAQNSTNGITFIDIFEVYEADKRIVMFKIPATAISTPTAWKGHWYGRDGESLVALSQEELERIRGQARYDWSKQVVQKSSIKDLDTNAIQIARKGYKEKHSSEYISDETDRMSDEEFLTKLKLIVDGKLTNAAMVLLGNPDHDNLLDVPVSAMWRLHGLKERLKDYSEFRMPFITLSNRIYAKIRNLTYRYMPNQLTLDTTITQQYNEDLLKELLLNCIAHQDYTQGGRIYVDELEDVVIISNPGSFIPGDVRKVLITGYTAPYYRNLLLAETMANFKLIDTAQWGIRKVFDTQRDRYFPLPDYDLSTYNKVAVTVYGKLLDQNYTRLLFSRGDLELESVYLLDRVQKKLPLTKEQYQMLRKLGVIEGKAPKIFISLEVAAIVDKRAQYTKNRAMDDKYYIDLIANYLRQFGIGTKEELVKLLSDKLSDVLDAKQKDNKVRSLLRAMHNNGMIERTTQNKRSGAWRLAQSE